MNKEKNSTELLKEISNLFKEIDDIKESDIKDAINNIIIEAKEKEG